MPIYGYVRRQRPLPTNDQLKIVTDYQCQRLFIEHPSYRHTTELARLIAILEPGDTVVIASLQVLGNTTPEVANCLATFRDKQVQLISWSTQLHLNYYKRTSGLL